METEFDTEQAKNRWLQEGNSLTYRPSVTTISRENLHVNIIAPLVNSAMLVVVLIALVVLTQRVNTLHAITEEHTGTADSRWSRVESSLNDRTREYFNRVITYQNVRFEELHRWIANRNTGGE